MKLEWKQVFPNLAPPPRGLEKLQSRLDREPAEKQRLERFLRPARWIPAAAATGMMLWMAVSATRPDNNRGPSLLDLVTRDVENPALIRLGLAPAPVETVTLLPNETHRVSAERVGVDDPNVVYYRILVLPDDN